MITKLRASLLLGIYQFEIIMLDLGKCWNNSIITKSYPPIRKRKKVKYEGIGTNLQDWKIYFDKESKYHMLLCKTKNNFRDFAL